MDAILHANMILSWYENIPSEEMPPKWMWTLAEELEKHFTWLKDKRGGGGERDEEPSGPAIRNDYARNRGANVR